MSKESQSMSNRRSEVRMEILESTLQRLACDVIRSVSVRGSTISSKLGLRQTITFCCNQGFELSSCLAYPMRLPTRSASQYCKCSVELRGGDDDHDASKAVMSVLVLSGVGSQSCRRNDCS